MLEGSSRVRLSGSMPEVVSSEMVEASRAVAKTRRPKDAGGVS